MVAWQAVVGLGHSKFGWVGLGGVGLVAGAKPGAPVGMATSGVAAGISWSGCAEHQCAGLGVRFVAYMLDDTRQACGMAEEQVGWALVR